MIRVRYVGVRYVVDAATLLGIAIGLALMLQPSWSGGLRAGFWVTLGATAAQIVVSHLPRRAGE